MSKQKIFRIKIENSVRLCKIVLKTILHTAILHRDSILRHSLQHFSKLMRKQLITVSFW